MVALLHYGIGMLILYKSCFNTIIMVFFRYGTPYIQKPIYMRKLAISLSKGGVGKTTTAVNLSHGLARMGKRVLLVDLDTQGQDAAFLGVKPHLTASHGLAALVEGNAAPEDTVLEARENLWLMAGGRPLAGLRLHIDQKEFAGEYTIAESLEPLEYKFDYIILDTAPGWDSLSANALFYATEIVMPASLEAATLEGIVEFQHSLGRIQKYHKDLKLKYVVPTLLDGRVRKSAEILEILQQHFPDKLCPPIRYNVRVSEAAGFGQTIFEYAPDSTGAADYQKLTLTIENHG